MTTFDIKKIRSKLNMTQQELATVLGVSLSTVANWEAAPPRAHPSKMAQRLITSLLEKRRTR